MISDREFDIISQRGLFMRYLDGQALHPEPNGDRCTLGDEQGEGCVGVLKGMPAYSDDDMVRNSRLYNIRSGTQHQNAAAAQTRTKPGVSLSFSPSAACTARRTRPRARPVNLGVDFQELDFQEAVILMCFALEEDQPYTDTVVWGNAEHCDASDGQRLMQEALRRRKLYPKKPMAHKLDTAWARPALDVMMKTTAAKNELSAQPGSADYIRSLGYASFEPGPHQGVSAISWPKDQLKQAKNVVEHGPSHLATMKSNSEEVKKFLGENLPVDVFRRMSRAESNEARSISDAWTVASLDQ